MPIGELCVRDVIVCTRSTTIHEAARLMRQHHVGDLLVVNGSGAKQRPVGIITDRDIVLSVIALQLDPSVFTVGDLATREIVSVREEQGIFETIQEMRKHGVRRMPVLDEEGGLIGIVSIDDLIQLLAEEMGELAKLISQEQAQETKLRT